MIMGNTDKKEFKIRKREERKLKSVYVQEEPFKTLMKVAVVMTTTMIIAMRSHLHGPLACSTNLRMHGKVVEREFVQ